MHAILDIQLGKCCEAPVMKMDDIGLSLLYILFCWYTAQVRIVA